MKVDIKSLFENGEYEEIVSNFDSKEDNLTIDERMLLALANYKLGRKNRPISILRNILKLDPENRDALYNLLEIYKRLEKWNRVREYVSRCYHLDPNSWVVHDILSDLFFFEGFYGRAIDHLLFAMKNAPPEATPLLSQKFDNFKRKFEEAKTRKKVALICAVGFDNFVNDIIRELSNEYWVQKHLVRNTNEICAAVDWADIVWLEWANEVAVEATKYQGLLDKKVFLRLHGYEAYRKDFLNGIDWSKVDGVIFVAEHVMKAAIDNQPKLKERRIILIPNGIDIGKYNYRSRSKGYKIGFLGFMNYKKNPMLMIQILKKLVDIDERYRIYWGGKMQDDRIWDYLNYILREMKLEDHFTFEGWVDDTDEWLEDKDIFLSTSIHEGYGVAIMEAMVKGIKPVIHNFYVASEFYPREYIFDTVDEAVEMITSEDYDSSKYRKFVETYSLDEQVRKIKELFEEEEKKVTTQVAIHRESQRHPNILLFVIDSLRYDEGEFLGERIQDFNPVKFKRAFSSGPSTPFAMLGLFYGIYAMDRDRKIIPLTLILKNCGYHTFGHNGGNLYCSDVYAQFDRFFDYFEERFKGVATQNLMNYGFPSCEDVYSSFIKWWNSDHREPVFAWFQFMDVHGKYSHLSYLPEDLRKHTERILNSEKYRRTKSVSPEELDILKEARHMTLARVMDVISNIVKMVPPPRLLLLLSDHGQGFMERGFYEHPGWVYDELIHIPFYVITEDKHLLEDLRKLDNTLVSLVDVPAFITDIVASMPRFGRGNSFLKGERKLVITEGYRMKNQESHDPSFRGLHIVSFRSQDWKLVKENGREYFFSLMDDEGERVPREVPEEVKKEAELYLMKESRDYLSWLVKMGRS